ncbi:MAG: DUF3788 family protein [Saprospiraceae bacterium]|nr:DUF3788 family protein [Saprospiraceae bacterium]
MMDGLSISPDKHVKPNEKDLVLKLGHTYQLWSDIHDYVMEVDPKGKSDWNFPGKKYSWSYQIKYNRRAIIYFLPREQFFRVTFVFGQKATDQILQSDVKADIKDELKQARKYPEGRGISLDVRNEKILPDIFTLIDIKLAN